MFLRGDVARIVEWAQRFNVRVAVRQFAEETGCCTHEGDFLLLHLAAMVSWPEFAKSLKMLVLRNRRQQGRGHKRS